MTKSKEPVDSLTPLVAPEETVLPAPPRVSELVGLLTSSPRTQRAGRIPKALCRRRGRWHNRAERLPIW